MKTRTRVFAVIYAFLFIATGVMSISEMDASLPEAQQISAVIVGVLYMILGLLWLGLLTRRPVFWALLMACHTMGLIHGWLSATVGYRARLAAVAHGASLPISQASRYWEIGTIVVTILVPLVFLLVDRPNLRGDLLRKPSQSSEPVDSGTDSARV